MENLIKEYLVTIEQLTGKPVEVPVVINGRIRNCLGQYRAAVNRNTGEMTPMDIRIAKHVHAEDLWNVLAHECAHYYASLEDTASITLPSDLAHNHPVFVHYCNLLDTCPKPYMPANKSAENLEKSKRYIATCSGCGKEITRYSTKSNKIVKVGGAGWSARCCKAPLVITDSKTGKIVPPKY